MPHPIPADADVDPLPASDDGAAMTVTVRDRSRETPWGSGPTNPVIRTVAISRRCPTCGGPRGVPRPLQQCDDGAHYVVDVWSNPCRHVDLYSDVVREAEAAQPVVQTDAVTVP